MLGLGLVRAVISLCLWHQKLSLVLRQAQFPPGIGHPRGIACVLGQQASVTTVMTVDTFLGFRTGSSWMPRWSVNLAPRTGFRLGSLSVESAFQSS